MNIDVVRKSDRFVLTLGLITSFVGCTIEPRPVVEEDPAATQAATEPKADGGAEEKEEAKIPAGGGADGKDTKPAACTASFTKDVLPGLASCGATQCHGTRFGPAIRIEPKDVAITYLELTTFTLAGKPYVKAGATDAEASAIHCHLAGKCGKKMPPIGGTIPPALVQSVDSWLACGAPKN